MESEVRKSKRTKSRADVSFDSQGHRDMVTFTEPGDGYVAPVEPLEDRGIVGELEEDIMEEEELEEEVWVFDEEGVV